jgi:CheY-like chemotaxis protein
MTGMMLRRMGHQITTAENGAMAVKAVIDHYNSTNTTFDVILMDLQMPVMDGLEATRRIRDFEQRQCPEGIHHLVVGMSANSDTDTVDEAFASNIDLFMPKPFNMIAFNEKVLSQCKSASQSLDESISTELSTTEREINDSKKSTAISSLLSSSVTSENIS